jgi:hypothetical protein
MVVFRTGKESKAGTAAGGGRVAFEVDRADKGGARGLERRDPH